MMASIEWALEYVRRGWYVLPLYPVIGGRCACPDRIYKVGPDPSRWKCSPGKHPYANLSHGVKDATNDPDKVKLWWGPTMWPDAGIGIALVPSGLLDVAPDGVDDLADFIARGLPETLTFRSGGGEGHQHFLYRLEAGGPLARLCVTGHYDIMSDGYCAAPSTLHVSGKPYTWLNYDTLLEPAEPPLWTVQLLIDQINGRTPAASASVPGEAIVGENGEPPLEIDRDVWDGEGFSDRSSVLWAIAGELAAAGANEATIVAALRERDLSLGLNKYTGRKDQEARYRECARRQLANALPRAHVNGTATATATVTSAPTAPPSAEPDWPEPMAPGAFYGPLGEFVEQASRQSEADPAALLGSLLSAVSACLYPQTAARAGDAYHPVRINSILVGPTAQGRKGSAGKVAENVARAVDDVFLSHIVEGLSSGEGLVWQIRDPIERMDPKKQTLVVADPGVQDKRLLVMETELGMTLRVLQREGNTLSGMIRRAWDLPPHATLESLVKNSPGRATGAHIVIAGHVTREELLRYVDRTDLVNGFANRFLWFASKQAQLLPFGEEVDPHLVADFAHVVQQARDWSLDPHRMSWAPSVRAVWEQAYQDFTSVPRGGLYGAVTARVAAQVLRVAELFSVLERVNQITEDALRAALAVWDYVDRTCQWIFGSIMGDRHADDILIGLRSEGPMTRTQLSAYLGRHVNKAEIERALALLLSAQRATFDKVPTGGRAAEAWRAL